MPQDDAAVADARFERRACRVLTRIRAPRQAWRLQAGRSSEPPRDAFSDGFRGGCSAGVRRPSRSSRADGRGGVGAGPLAHGPQAWGDGARRWPRAARM